MNIREIAVLLCYGLAILFSAAFGLIYLLRPRFMPYHQEAAEVTWQELDPRLQALVLALMRTAGGGLLAAAISTAIMVLIPLQAGEAWAYYATPAVALAAAGPALYATILVRKRTRAHPPVLLAASSVGLIVLGFIFSLL